jgi:hypothetical protein
VLVVRKSRGRELVHTVFALPFFALYYGALLGWPSSVDDALDTVRGMTRWGEGGIASIFWWLVVVAPVIIAVPPLLRGLRVVGGGEAYTFDATQGMLLRNDTRLAGLAEVTQLQLWVIAGKGVEDRLIAVLRDGRRITLLEQTDGDVAGAAGAIAEVTGIPLVRTETSSPVPPFVP